MPTQFLKHILIQVIISHYPLSIFQTNMPQIKSQEIGLIYIYIYIFFFFKFPLARTPPPLPSPKKKLSQPTLYIKYTNQHYPISRLVNT